MKKDSLQIYDESIKELNGYSNKELVKTKFWINICLFICSDLGHFLISLPGILPVFIFWGLTFNNLIAIFIIQFVAFYFYKKTDIYKSLMDDKKEFQITKQAILDIQEIRKSSPN